MPHAHSLIGKNASNGVVTVQIGPEQGMTARYMFSIIITIVFANFRDISFNIDIVALKYFYCQTVSSGYMLRNMFCQIHFSFLLHD